MRILLLTLLSLTLIGCNKQTFEVSVTNQTDLPLTVGLIKEGPPEESQWSTPDQQAIYTQLTVLPPWGHKIPPGRTLDSGKVTGEFPSGTTAYLRVYRGVHSNAELIGMGSPAMGRLDVLLFPGPNTIVIQDDPKKGLTAQRTAAPPP